MNYIKERDEDSHRYWVEFLNNPNGYDINQEWEGIDLDGTLAIWDGFKGYEHIGEPVPLMLKRVLDMIESGITIKIFTARAGNRKAIPYIKTWLRDHGLPDLEIINVKDAYCKRIWDDKAIQVEINTGIIVE